MLRSLFLAARTRGRWWNRIPEFVEPGIKIGPTQFWWWRRLRGLGWAERCSKAAADAERTVVDERVLRTLRRPTWSAATRVPFLALLRSLRAHALESGA